MQSFDGEVIGVPGCPRITGWSAIICYLTIIDIQSQGETMGAVVQPLPTSHLIFRAPTNAAGKCWMDALELALRCSSLLATRKPNRSSAVKLPPSLPPLSLFSIFDCEL